MVKSTAKRGTRSGKHFRSKPNVSRERRIAKLPVRVDVAFSCDKRNGAVKLAKGRRRVAAVARTRGPGARKRNGSTSTSRLRGFGTFCGLYYTGEKVKFRGLASYRNLLPAKGSWGPISVEIKRKVEVEW